NRPLQFRNQSVDRHRYETYLKKSCMERAGSISHEQIEKSRAALQNPPQSELRGLTKKQAIRALLAEIQALQNQGCSSKLIAKLLSDSGIPMSGALLNSYLQRLRRESVRKRPKRANSPKETRPKAPPRTRRSPPKSEGPVELKPPVGTSATSASTIAT